MATPRAKRLTIYQSRRHLFAALLFLVVPFVFLFIFSHFAKIAASSLFLDLSASFGRMLIAYAISVVLGWLCAISFYQGKRAMIALPIFDVLQSFPTFAALPMAVFFLGPSNFTVIFFLVIAIIWPIFFSIISSLKLIRHDWQEAAEIAGLSGFDYLRFFILPVTFTGLVTGSIIGLGDGWEALVATEIIVGVKLGLGSFFKLFSQNVSITSFGIIGLLILVFSINRIIWLPLLDRSHRQMEE